MIDTSIYDIFEGTTSISAVIKSIRSGSASRSIVKVLYDVDRVSKKTRELGFLRHAADELGFEMLESNNDEISSLTSGNTHGGIIAVCTKRSFPDLNVNYLTSGDFYALIEGIEDPYNFGYSIRSLYAAGADGIVLPQRNWMEFAGTVARSSAGTSELSEIVLSEDTFEAVKMFKERGFKIVCSNIRDSVSLYDCDFSEPVLLIVGGEKRGISRRILDLADVNVRIEYGRDFMGSLPSVSAISVMAFEIARKKGKLR
jgi:23S rRNA (guanosine2251-2'-O)-methyltransferase